MKKLRLKLSYSYLWKFGLLSVPAVAVIAVSCGESSAPTATNKINASASNLQTIQFTGSTRNLEFTIPTSLTHVNDSNQLVEGGKTQALDVQGKLTLTVEGATIAVNESFMPLELLKSYLAGEITIVNNEMVINANKPNRQTVLERFGSAYGLRTQHLTTINNPELYGEWKIGLKLRYAPRQGYDVSDISEVDAQLTQLKSNVNLDLAFEKDPIILSSLRSTFGYTPGSTNAAVAWKSNIDINSLPAAWRKYVAGLRFSTSNPIDVTKIVWELSRANAFDPDFNKRFLLMQLQPKANYILSFDYYDLSSLADLSKLPIQVDSLPAYSAINLTQQVVMSANNGALVIDESAVALPVGTKVEYQIGSGAYFSKDDFVKEIQKQTSLNVSDIYAHLASIDTSLYIINNDKRVRPNVSAIRGFQNTTTLFNAAKLLAVDLTSSEPSALAWNNVPSVPSELAVAVSGVQYLAGDFPSLASAQASSNWAVILPSAINPTWTGYNFWMRAAINSGYLVNEAIADLSVSSRLSDVLPSTSVALLETSALATIRAVTATSTHDSITWTNTFTIPASLATYVDHVEYALGNYPQESSLSAATWTANIPSTADFESQNRYLWMRLVPKPRTKLSKQYLNLTTSSQVQSVRGKVDLASGFNNIDLTQVSISGSLAYAVIDESRVNLVNGTQVTYQTRTGTWVSRAEFITYLASNVGTILEANFNQFRARLEVTDAQRFTIINRREATPSAANLTESSDVLPRNISDALLALSLTASSRHNNLTWTNLITTLPTGASSFSYLSGNYATLDAVKAAPANLWSSSLPSATDFDHAARFVWVRVSSSQGYTFTNPYLNLTTSSKIAQVLSSIDALTAHSTVDLTQISITGTTSAATVSTSGVTLPSSTTLKYKLGTSNWLTAAELVTLLSTKAYDYTPVELATTEARLEVIDTALYSLTDNKQALVNTSTLKISYTNLPSVIISYLSAIKPTTTSRHNAISWVNDGTIPSWVASVSYLSGATYDTEEAAKLATSGAWLAVLPTSVDFNHDDRHIWARVNPASGYEIINPYFDMTTTSDIMKVISAVDALSGFSLVDLSKIKVTFSSPTSAPAVNTTALVVAFATIAGFNLELSFNKNTNNEDIWYSQAAFISAATNVGIPDNNTPIKIRMVSSDSAKYEVANSRQVTVSPTLNYDTSWTIRLILTDTTAPYTNTMGHLSFIDEKGAALSRDSYTTWSTDSRAAAKTYLAVFGNDTGIPTYNNAILFEFTTGKTIGAVQIQFAANTPQADLVNDFDINDTSTGLTTRGNYSNSLVAYKLVLQNYNQATGLATFAIVKV